jgi:hypothetical protein
MVASASSAEVMVVFPVSVERSMVDEPITTRLLALPVKVFTTPLEVCRDVTGASVDVLTLEVTVDPSAFVVVTAMVVGSNVELSAGEELEESCDGVAEGSWEEVESTITSVPDVVGVSLADSPSVEEEPSGVGVVD